MSVIAPEMVETRSLKALIMFGSWAVVSVTICVMSGMYGAIASAMLVIAPEMVETIPSKALIMFGSWAVVSVTIPVMAGMYGASASTMEVTAPEMVVTTSEKVLVISAIRGSNAEIIFAIPSDMPGKASPMAVPMEVITVPMASAIPPAFSLMPERMLPVISTPFARIPGRASPMAPTIPPMDSVMVVRMLGASVVIPLIRLETISPPLPSTSGRCSVMPVTKFVTAEMAPVIRSGAASIMPLTSVPTSSAAVTSSSGIFSDMLDMKSERTTVAFFIISGPLSTIPFTSSVSISTPDSNRVGSTVTIFEASSVTMDAAAGSRSGRLSVIAPRREEIICDPVETISGSTSFSFSDMLPIPSFIMPTPPSESPEKMAVKPSMTVVIPGRNWAIILFFRPSKLCVMFWSESWKAAEAFTSSSLMTIPRSWACCRMASMSSAEVFKRAPISVAPFPKSSWARRARSVSSWTPVKAVIVLFQSSSRLIFCASSAEMPRAWKASEPFSAAVDSFTMLFFSESMLVPLCCAIKSHS